ncbi:hypothetical protein ACFQ0M_09930 [Kitasatospora aburaviensis]
MTNRPGGFERIMTVPYLIRELTVHNCLSEIRSGAVDELRLAVDSLASFPARGGADGTDVAVPERLAAVAELCRAVDGVLDSLVVQAAAEAAEEGWTAARMASEHAVYYAR